MDYKAIARRAFDKVLTRAGIGGFYEPITDSIYVNKDQNHPYQDTLAHELNHREMAHKPHNFHTAEARRIAANFAARVDPKKRSLGAYPRSDIPGEMMAFAAGANASETDSAQQAQWPHPGWHLLTKEEKLFFLRNRDGWMTDQAFLNSNRGLQRYKNIGRRLQGRVQSWFE